MPASASRPVAVTDTRSNANDQLDRAARVVGRGKRALVFDAISAGKRAVKSVSEIVEATGLSRKEVLTHGRVLANEGMVHQVKVGTETGYQKDNFLAQNRKAIRALGRDPKRLAALATKTRPLARQEVTIQVSSSRISIRQIFVDEIREFAKCASAAELSAGLVLPEAVIKKGFAALLRERGDFVDWGGEKSDLYTSQLHVGKVRLTAAVAFKGPGTKGRLTIAKMGKNADQIQRLFNNAADLFMIQYHGQVDEAVVTEMRTYASVKSVLEGREILYCVIDGSDTARLIAAYPDRFKETT